jgi:hypothetical protein
MEDKINIIFTRIAEEYCHLKSSHKKILYDNYNIDSGTDYARYILAEICYDENGESIY